MKALIYKQYGGPEVLRWHDLPIPEPAADEVLIAVKAASINPSDIKLRNGQFKSNNDPFTRTMGMDVAGIVAKTGADVTTVKMGDKVFAYTGIKGGSFADYTVASAKNVFLIPPATSYEEATSLPMNAGTALKVSNEYVKPAPGKKILINGAAGGQGLFLVQYALNAGATVTGTAGSADSMEILRDLGIDEVIDFKTTNVLKEDARYDAIVDTSGRMDFDQAKNILNEGGVFTTMVPKTDPSKPGRTEGTKKELLVNAVPGPTEFSAVQQMAADGKIKAIVGKTYPMMNAIDALKEFENTRLEVTGKVVLVK